MPRHEPAFLLLAAALFAAPAAAQQDLYSNGPYVTHTGMGAGGADVSVLQTAIGSNVYGFQTQQIPGNFRLADDFTVPAGGWTISSFIFVEFQTNAPAGTPTINAANFRIWHGRPDDPGSTVVFGNTTLNRWVSSTAAHCYRAPDTNLLATTREIYRVEAAVSPPLHLDPGTYWVDWQTSGTVASGPYNVPVTILGQGGAPNANARAFDGTMWINARDSSTFVAQEMVFTVRGTSGGPAGCYANCDGSTAVPFLNVNDFICFQSRFAAADTFANCDGSTAPPVLNVNDFICFQGRFAAGCSAP